MRPLLRRVWDGWKRFAFWLGDKQATLVYTLLYFALLGPVALVRRAVSDPLLVRGRHRTTFWRSRAETPPTLADARRQ
jgi:hypothetical protein